ncbi:HTH-type transcriptional repressor PurR [Corynebacterium heidelbergense]|nr:LacI family DNA-binding transcriptional regulator [Corynebacterium heidelbergense]WCZ35923.1 HTH-type transcriptional repressor PurR [Corynebacterium heidelbergense]
MQSHQRRGTLASIAAELGVSRTTVSNAYNRPDQLSEELRDRIFRTAARIGYPGPDPTARSLRMRRAGAIGVLLTEELTYAFEDQASVEFMAGVSLSCGNLGASMLLIPAGVGGDSGAKQLVHQASVDGFIVYSVAANDPFLQVVMSRGMPTVICDQPADRRRVPFIGIDDREAIKPVVRQVLEAGHTRIGVLCIRLDRSPNDGFVSRERLASAQMHVQRDRVRGVLEVIEDATLDPAQVPVVERHVNNPEQTYSAAAQLLREHPELTAVVCTTDSMALGLTAYAADAGISIPGELSVTGFDGIPQAVGAGITTVRQPSREKGQRAGDALAQLIAVAPRAGEQRVLLPTQVVPGTSITSPRAAGVLSVG